ncbi:hypothetical protein [Hellea balneolensis]|uniref:hypothetical protein n=1 Tax=Hellea balneolensis TaxID=287478 RepID=UPI00040A25F2|nr:hypothetical protein [Hellea balneolensis]
MTKIEDMSEPQRQAWITLLADGAVFAYFWSKTTIGLSPQLIHTNIEAFGKIILSVVIVTVILHAVIASIFDMRKRKELYEKDERDIAIERKGAHWGYRLMQWGVGGIIITVLLHSLGGEDFIWPISIEKPTEIIFALLVISYIADLAKQSIVIWAYRT